MSHSGWVNRRRGAHAAVKEWLTVSPGDESQAIRVACGGPEKEIIVFTSQIDSHADSPVAASRRSALVALALAVVVGLTVLVLVLTAETSVPRAASDGPRHAAAHTFTIPHIQGLDTPPPVRSVQPASASTAPGYMRDPSTHALLRVPTDTAVEPTGLVGSRFYGRH
jgi:hypothetical protein